VLQGLRTQWKSSAGVGAPMFRRGSGVVPAEMFRVGCDGQARIAAPKQADGPTNCLFPVHPHTQETADTLGLLSVGFWTGVAAASTCCRGARYFFGVRTGSRLSLLAWRRACTGELKDTERQR
jgi:hypothetical protein